MEAQSHLRDAYRYLTDVRNELAKELIADLKDMVQSYVEDLYDFEAALFGLYHNKSDDRQKMIEELQDAKHPRVAQWRQEMLVIHRQYYAAKDVIGTYYTDEMRLDLIISFGDVDATCHRAPCYYAIPNKTCTCGRPLRWT